MKQWLTTGQTESCDKLPSILWKGRKPTSEEIDAKYKELLPDEYSEVGFVNWDLDVFDGFEDVVELK
jgi:hypothetical protein